MGQLIPGAEPWAARGSGADAKIGVLVLHGFTGNPRTSTPLAKRLNQAGFSVDVPRFPGHGTTYQDMALTRYADWRDEASRGVDRLTQSCESVLVVGLSMGGTIALDLAWERGAELRGVVPINATVLTRTDPISRLAPLISRVIPWVPSKVAGLAENDAAAGFDEMAYQRIPTKAAQSFLNELERIHRSLPDIRIPVLVAYSPQDHSVPCANSRAIVREVPDAQELVLPNSFHLATVDHDAELLAERIVDFAHQVSLSSKRAS